MEQSRGYVKYHKLHIVDNVLKKLLEYVSVPIYFGMYKEVQVIHIICVEDNGTVEW